MNSRRNENRLRRGKKGGNRAPQAWEKSKDRKEGWPRSSEKKWRCSEKSTLYFAAVHVPTVLKSGSLNLLESYGPLQACNGIALPFTLLLCACSDYLFRSFKFLMTLTTIAEVRRCTGLARGFFHQEWFDANEYEISAPQCPTHYSPAGNGNVLHVVVLQNIRQSGIIVSDVLNSDHLTVIFHILEHVRITYPLAPVEKNHRFGIVSKPHL
jgi:hypothetical protein